MNSLIENANLWGERIVAFAGPMLWQSSILIALVFALDLILRHKLRVTIRYALWLVVLVKLLLPPTLALPTSAAWWLRPSPVLPQPRAIQTVVTYGDIITARPSPSEPIVFAPPPSPRLSPQGRMLLAWAGVCAGLLAWLAVRWWQVARDVRRAADAPSWVNEILHDARGTLAMRHGVRLKVTERAISPAVCGLFQPVILLPLSLVERLSPGQLRAVLLHELVHLKRGDVWLNCGQALLQIAYWWHPLLWFANARIRRVREEAVDDAVMLALRDDAESYAPTLLEVAKFAFRRPLASLGLVGIMESRSALRQRIERLVNFNAPRRTRFPIIPLLGIAAFTALAVPMGEAPVKPREPLPALQANSGSQPQRSPISVESTAVEYDVGTGTASATGGAIVRSGETVLTADSVTVNQTTGEVVAEGNVLVENNNSVLSADKVRYNSNADLSKGGPTQLPAGVIAFDDETKEATVNPGEAEAKFTFNLTNVSSADVTITQVLTSCGCTVAQLPATPWRLAPGASGQIPVTMNVAGKNGVLTKTVTLNSDRGARMLTVRATIQPVSNAAAPPALSSEPASTDSSQLRVRRYNVRPNIFDEILEDARRQPLPQTNALTVLRDYFATLGMDPSPPKSFYLNDRRDELIVRATLKDMDIIERAIPTLSAATAQVHVEARFVEIETGNDQGGAGFDWFLGNTMMNSAPPTATENSTSPNAVSNRPAQLTGILTDPQYRAVLRALEKRKGVEVLSNQEVTTLSGRQAQIAVVELRTVVNGMNLPVPIPPGTTPTNSPANSPYQTQTLPFGPTLDVIPHVGADGYTIQMTVIPTVTEFLGYDDPGRSVDPKNGSRKDDDVLPLPRFRIRTTSVTANVWDGQTLVLGAPNGEVISKTEAGGTEMKPFSGKTKLLLVFVTPTLVDPAGNRVHTEEEMPFARDGVPPQAPVK